VRPVLRLRAPGLKRRFLRSCRLFSILYLLCLIFAAIPALAQGDACSCGPDLSCLERSQFKVGEIHIETFFRQNVPLDAVFKVQQLLFSDFTSIKPRLALQEGKAFSRDGYNSSQVTLAGLVGRPNVGERFKLAYIEPSLTNCKADALTVDVLYKVFTTDGLSFITSASERANDKITRSVLIPIPGSDKFQPLFYAGFNQSRGTFIGSRAVVKTGLRIFDQFGLDVSGSRSSAAVDTALAGSANFAGGFVSYAQWKLGYSYSNIPADAIRLKDSIFRLQFFSGSRPAGPLGMALRFGASVEGGHQQSDFGTSLNTFPSTPAAAPYGAIKTYVGTTMNWGRQAWKNSYGLQLGQADTAMHVDYVKQVADTQYSVRFLTGEHRPLRLDVGGSAGLIASKSNLIPVGERFIGGNVRSNFILGSDWEINSGPMIRSFPQNGLNLVRPDLPIGGKNFYSANLTLSQTLWRRSAVPEELEHLAELKIKLNGAINTERENAKGSYLYLAPDFKNLLLDIDKLETMLKGLEAALQMTKASGPSAPVVSAIDAFFDLDDDSNYLPVPDALEAIANAKADKTSAVDKAVALVKDDENLGTQAYVTVVISKINKATAAFSAAGMSTAEWTSQLRSLQEIQGAMLEKIQRVNDVGKYNPADIASVTEIVDELSPVLENIEQQLSGLPAPSRSDAAGEYEARLDDVNQYLNAAKDGVQQVKEDDVTVRGAERLAVGYGEVASAILPELVRSIRALEAELKRKNLASQAQSLEVEAGHLAGARADIKQQLQKVQVPEIEKKANRDVAFTGRTLDVIFRELNLVSVSPLVVFDVARIGPAADPRYAKPRYGLGGGVRFSLVTLDLDIGYSSNPNPLPGERRGAWVFSLNMNDLFR